MIISCNIVHGIILLLTLGLYIFLYFRLKNCETFSPDYPMSRGMLEPSPENLRTCKSTQEFCNAYRTYGIPMNICMNKFRPDCNTVDSVPPLRNLCDSPGEIIQG